jgi:hypothetical protein
LPAADAGLLIRYRGTAPRRAAAAVKEAVGDETGVSAVQDDGVPAGDVGQLGNDLGAVVTPRGSAVPLVLRRKRA